MRLNIPAGAQEILEKLNAAGHQAYVVGGCVRDTLLGQEPKDWDICTSARPEEMISVFRGYHVVETGLKHGTLTVVIGHVPYEVTTFRVDGTYTDHRHPDQVSFVADVREDLARRDFTVNAMAYHPETGLLDVFGGEEDLRQKVLRCVGEPAVRFEEDALRILRALRFASVYGLKIHPETERQIHLLYPTLEDVAGERIRVELAKLLCGASCGSILRDYSDVLAFFLPEIRNCVGFDQRTKYHRFPVYEHIVQAVESVSPQETLRMAMLLHDVGKPSCFFVDENGVGHAYGHQKKSAEIAVPLLDRLRMDTATRDRVLLLVENHDIELRPDRTLLLRRLNQFGEETLRQLILIHHADSIAKGTETRQAVDAWKENMFQTLDALLAEKPCYSIRDLAVNGKDLMNAGVPKGPIIGETLNRLLLQVMEGSMPNEREALLKGI